MVSLTIFKSIFDNKTNKRMDFPDFPAFEKFLYKLSDENLASKKDAVLMSPAVYTPDTTRKNDNVIEWASWCCVDVDEYIPEGDLKDDLVQRFGDHYFVCYSTASSTVDQAKFRIVFPLTTSVERDKIKHFWYALNTELGDLADKQTKDLSRMYYIPARYALAHNFIFSHRDGDYINPDQLMEKHAYAQKSTLNNFFDRLPEEIQKEVIKHRKEKLDQTDVHWTSYRDCPFFPRQLEAEYRTINNTGWYHKMFQIMVATAGNAIKRKYPITAAEISTMCRELDNETGGWYANRPMDKEADRALEYVYKNI